jgi:hypothetical protein
MRSRPHCLQLQRRAQASSRLEYLRREIAKEFITGTQHKVKDLDTFGI